MGRNKLLVTFFIFSITYIGLTFGISPDAAAQAKYNLDNTEIQILRLTLVLPIILIWALAFYGYAKFRDYALTVKDSKEGEGWLNLVRGLLGLALWLPLTSIIGSIGSYIYHKNPGLTETVIITMNYINLIIVLAAFVFLYKGARRLVGSVKTPAPATLAAESMVLLAALSGLFAYLTLSSPNKTVPVDEVTPAAYYLPDWLLVTTIVIPYIIVFYLGFKVVQHIHSYRKKVQGSIYKEALRYLGAGIGVAVISLMSLRYLTSVTSVFNDSALRTVLLLLYLLIFLIAAGYILIALGAKRLQKLEEV